MEIQDSQNVHSDLHQAPSPSSGLLQNEICYYLLGSSTIVKDAHYYLGICGQVCEACEEASLGCDLLRVSDTPWSFMMSRDRPRVHDA